MLIATKPTSYPARISWLLAVVSILAMPLMLRAADSAPLSDYYENTLLWKNTETGAVGRLWLNRDGRYFAFYNLGSQPRPPGIDGPFQVEARIGTYTMREANGQQAVCLWPAAPRIRLTAEVQNEPFAANRCYALTTHRAGDTWSEASGTAGREMKYWFVHGR